jgi:hypothetical protein
MRAVAVRRGSAGGALALALVAIAGSAFGVRGATAAVSSPSLGVRVYAMPGTGDLRGVSCPADGQCIVTGSSSPIPTAGGSTTAGVVIPIVGGEPGDVQQVGGTTELFGVGCGSADDCLAVGFSGDTGIGQAVPITKGVPGGPTSIDGTGSLFGVDCLVPTTCLIAGEDTTFQ